MPRYRCYLFNDQNHIVKAEVLECQDDDGACQWAERLPLDIRRCSHVELWDGARLVKRYAVRPDPAVASDPNRTDSSIV
jgi:hypothetical protein